MYLSLLVIVLALIGIVLGCVEDIANRKSSPVKKCLAGIVFVLTLPLAFLTVGMLLSGLGESWSEIADTIILILEKYGVFPIVLIVIAIISRRNKLNDCNESSEKNTAAVVNEDGKYKLVMMLVAVLAVLALIIFGIVTSMAK